MAGTDGSTPAAGPTPLYAKIADDLRGKILGGYYGPGALLPSRNELAAEYGVSHITGRDALAVLSQEGYAHAVRGRGHIVSRKRPRLNLPAHLYAPPAAGLDALPAGDGAAAGGVTLDLRQLDVYQEVAPDNIALPLACGATPVWVRRAVWAAPGDRQALQIQVSWLPGLDAGAGPAISALDPALPWPQAVSQLTGRPVTHVRQATRARGANPFEARAFGFPAATKILVSHLTTYTAAHQPLEHSRFAWPTDAVRLIEEYPCPPARPS
jgi:DNA-binding GntR family transcriptional regulator